MWDVVKELAAALGALVAGVGGVTAFAFVLFKWLGEKWLSAKFAERLEAFRHEQQKEIEQVRFEISKLMDRTTKLHQREFEILPKAWRLLVNSYHSAKKIIAAFQSYPDLNRMTPNQLDEFLAESPLQDWQKRELREAADKNKYYQGEIFWHRAHLARKALSKSAVYTAKNGVFMPPALKAKFNNLEKLIHGALIEHEMNEEHKLIPRQRVEQMKFLNQGESMFEELEGEVQKRLWSAVDQKAN
jgi:hypothetical protein